MYIVMVNFYLEILLKAIFIGLETELKHDWRSSDIKKVNIITELYTKSVYMSVNLYTPKFFIYGLGFTQSSGSNDPHSSSA